MPKKHLQTRLTDRSAMLKRSPVRKARTPQELIEQVKAVREAYPSPPSIPSSFSPLEEKRPITSLHSTPFLASSNTKDDSDYLLNLSTLKSSNVFLKTKEHAEPEENRLFKRANLIQGEMGVFENHMMEEQTSCCPWWRRITQFFQRGQSKVQIKCIEQPLQDIGAFSTNESEPK